MAATKGVLCVGDPEWGRGEVFEGEPAAKKTRSNPQVYMDVTVRDKLAGHVQMLCSDVVPMTAGICLQKEAASAASSPSSCARMVISQTTVAPEASPFMEKFGDENFILKYTGPGLFSMANSSPNRNSSQFFLMCDKTEWLDGKHAVFGAVTEGLDVLWQIEAQGNKDGKPKQKVIIADCGELV